MHNYINNNWLRLTFRIYRIRLPIYNKNKRPINEDASTSAESENVEGVKEDDDDGQWQFVHPRGGKSLDVRLAAHSTVYYSATNSLIVFGGIMSSLARFSKLSDRILHSS